MVVDCATCAVRGPACAGCLVTAVVGGPPGHLRLDDAEGRAVRALADAGLLPPLCYLPLDAPVELIPTDLIAQHPDESCGYLPVELTPPVALPRRRPRRHAA